MSVTKETTAAPRAANPMKRAAKLIAEYRDLHLSQQAAAARKKELEQQLFELAEANRVNWFGNSNTCQIDVYGKLSYVNETTLIYDVNNYDEKQFASSFPECIDIKLKTSAIKGLCINPDVRADIEGLGVSLGTREKFTVTPNK